jgi:8-oxo-dGTP pyrophosphatase MutT (NUDIX family)
MELCNVVDQWGIHTGRVVTRGTELCSGEYYPVVHIWIRDETGQYLIQQRALHLEFAPGVWATTGGYVQAGEEYLDAAIREVAEELGIVLAAGDLRHIARVPKDDVVQDIWLVDCAGSALGAITLNEDVADTAWVFWSELERRVGVGEFFPYSYFSRLIE